MEAVLPRVTGWGKQKIEALEEGQTHHAGDYMWRLGGLSGLQSNETSRTKPPVQENKLRSNCSVSKVLRVQFGSSGIV